MIVDKETDIVERISSKVNDDSALIHARIAKGLAWSCLLQKMRNHLFELFPLVLQSRVGIFRESISRLLAKDEVLIDAYAPFAKFDKNAATQQTRHKCYQYWLPL